MDGQVFDSSIHIPAESEALSVELTASLLQRIFAGYHPADYAVRLWNGKTILPGTGLPPRFTLCLNHPGALRSMLWPPTASHLGEAYLRKHFEIEGDMIAAIGLGASLSDAPPSLTEWFGIGRDLLRLPNGHREDSVEPVRLRGALHSLERDRAAVQYHYDLANEFYALWLDERMIYSCAYFPTGAESLDAAQEAKLDLICRKLRLRPGETLLDIGCGWGGLSIYAAKKYGVQALGVTLSAKQAEWARERVREESLQKRVRIELRDYRELTGLSFDKIASVGMAEHVGAACLPGYFARVYQLLKPKGAFLCQAIADEERVAPASWFTRLFEPNRFFRNYIFPDHELVPLRVTAESAARAGFEVRDVESLREHYALTARCWLAGLEARWHEALGCVPERTLRLWRIYLAIMAYAFQARRLNLFQVLLAKPNSLEETEMPLTRAEWSTRRDTRIYPL
jgi:cyclopropane-fatty-acyl-phospholipid synthase